jgi:magnesium transporter
MDLRMSLARAFAAGYPMEAAAALEPRSAEEVAQVFHAIPPETAASVLFRMAPGPAANTVERLDVEYAASVFSKLTIDAALPLLRRVTAQRRDAIIEALPAEQADAVKAVIGFPTGSAGALMDPRAIALPADLTVEEALKVVRREAEHAHYNLYVVDRDRALLGVLNLRELMLAGPRDRLEAITRPALHRLLPNADRYAIVAHPGWRDVHSLPVVDRDGRFLGALRYRTLRRLEDELQDAGPGPDQITARALGDFFWVGVGGVIDAIAAAVAPRNPREGAPGTTKGRGNLPSPGSPGDREQQPEIEEG